MTVRNAGALDRDVPELSAGALPRKPRTEASARVRSWSWPTSTDATTLETRATSSLGARRTSRRSGEGAEAFCKSGTLLEVALHWLEIDCACPASALLLRAWRECAAAGALRRARRSTQATVAVRASSCDDLRRELFAALSSAASLLRALSCARRPAAAAALTHEAPVRPAPARSQAARAPLRLPRTNAGRARRRRRRSRLVSRPRRLARAPPSRIDCRGADKTAEGRETRVACTV